MFNAAGSGYSLPPVQILVSSCSAAVACVRICSVICRMYGQSQTTACAYTIYLRSDQIFVEIPVIDVVASITNASSEIARILILSQ